MYHEGQSIGSFNLQSVGIAVHGLFIAGDHAHSSGGIGSSGVGIRNALVSIHEVVGIQIGAVRPLQALTQVEGPSQAILADLIALGLAGLNLVVLVHNQQALESGDQHVGAVNGAVQRGVQSLGVGTYLNGNAGSGSGRTAGRGGIGAGSAAGCSGAGAAAAGSHAERHHGSQHES